MALKESASNDLSLAAYAHIYPSETNGSRDEVPCMAGINCRLQDYYRTGIRVPESIAVLEAINSQSEKVAGLKRWQVAEFRKNLWSLGFVEAGGPRSEGARVSSRGYSLLVPNRMVKAHQLKRDVATCLTRFVILRAVADADLECFTQLAIQHCLLRRSPQELRTEFFPYDSGNNFSHRWGFHLTTLETLEACRFLRRVGRKAAHSPDVLDPYSGNFRHRHFFGRTYRRPSRKVIRQALRESAGCYVPMFGPSDLGYAEVLKTILQARLLQNGYFQSEPGLSRLVLELAGKLGLTLFRSSEDIRWLGRGFFAVDGVELRNYASFRIMS